MASLMVVLVLLMTMLSGGAMAQSCTSAIVGLAPCLSYITGSSSTPSSSCCTQLSSVVQSQPICLCQVLNGGVSSYGITINQTQALGLPAACKVDTPPASQCNAVNQPSGSPVGSPVGSPTSSSPTDASTPEGSITPDDPTPPTGSSIPSTGTGSKSTTGNTSDANLTKFSLHFTFLLLIITPCITAMIAN